MGEGIEMHVDANMPVWIVSMAGIDALIVSVNAAFTATRGQ